MTVKPARRSPANALGASPPPNAATPAIDVPADATLDAVLARLREVTCRDVILEVAPDCPILLSMSDATHLEAVAAERDLRITVASTSSRHLSAAMVLGWATLDRSEPRDVPRVTADQPPSAPLPGAPPSDQRWDEEPAGPPPQFTAPVREVAAHDFVPGGLDGGRASGATGPPGPTPHDPPNQATSEPVARTIRPLFSRRDTPPNPDDAQAAPETSASDDEGWDATVASTEPSPPWRPRFVPANSAGSGLDALRTWIMSTRRAAIRVVPEPKTPPIGRVKRPAFVEPPADGDEDLAAVAVPHAVGGDGATTPVPPEPWTETEYWDARDAATTGGAASKRAVGPRAATARIAPWRRLLALVAGGVPLILVAMAAGYFLVASATVTLVARTSAVDVSFNVVVAELDPNSPQGAPTRERMVVPARRLSVPVEATAAVPATGVRYEPAVTAGGPVLLSNASTAPVAVAKGTMLTAEDQRSYVTLEPATVPPADPFDAARFGTVTVQVAAETRGSAGNAPAGSVRGRLPTGIFFNNRGAPIAGGADKAIPVVSSQDLAAARAAAERLAHDKGATAIAAALPPGNLALSGTTGVGDFTATYSSSEGTDGDSVTAAVHATATTLAYSPAEVSSKTEAELEQRLKAAVPAGDALIPGTWSPGTPVLVSEAPGIRTYSARGSARTRAKLGGATEREGLRQTLVNRDDRDARALLGSLPGVSSFSVRYSPSWAPRRMPWRASKIDIRFVEPER